MDQGNTKFYQRHITANISRLDERKDKYIHYRLSFLKEHCEPHHQHMRHIHSEIEKYKNMIDTQEEVIEQEPDILSIKNQVGSYSHTKEYFQSKLDQYEKKAIEYQSYNQELRKQVLSLKRDFKRQQDQVGFQLPFIGRHKSRSLVQDSDARSIVSKSFILPSVREHHNIQSENSISSSKVTIPKKKMINISEKIQHLKQFRINTQSVSVKSEQEVIRQELNESTEQQCSYRQKMTNLRQRITGFNKTETLFHDCFEVKKNSVQRSVSQLQSKLIVNREEFLNTCHAIGAKEGKIDFDSFKKLTCDEILTLFISFVWLNKRIMAQFTAKRRQIMDYMRKLPPS